MMEDGEIIHEEDYEDSDVDQAYLDYTCSSDVMNSQQSRIITENLELSITALRKDEERNRLQETTVKGQVKYFSPDGKIKFDSDTWKEQTLDFHQPEELLQHEQPPKKSLKLKKQKRAKKQKDATDDGDFVWRRPRKLRKDGGRDRSASNKVQIISRLTAVPEPELTKKYKTFQEKVEEETDVILKVEEETVVEPVAPENLTKSTIFDQDMKSDFAGDLILKGRTKQKRLKISQITKNKSSILLRNTVIKSFHGKTKSYMRTSLFLFDGDSWFRESIIWFVEWKWFEYFILFMIFLNSISLALFDYKDRRSLTFYNITVDRVNTVFTLVYAAEAMLKIIAYGLFKHKTAYLREYWNIIDFVVAVIGVVELSLSGSSSSKELRTLRTVRVLRPLKSVNAIPSIRKHVQILVTALPNFLNVAIFLIFIFVLMAILGLHQYSSQFFNRCRYTPEPIFENNTNAWIWPHVTPEDGAEARPCTMNGLGRYKCPNITFPDGNITATYCGNPYDFSTLIDIQTENVTTNGKIFFGVANFNNIFNSLILINQMISTDDWSSFMYNMIDIDHPAFAVIYSLINLILGNFFIMNLILAVVIDTFVNLNELEKRKQQLEEQRKGLGKEIMISDSDFCTSVEDEEQAAEGEDRSEFQLQGSAKVFGEVVMTVVNKERMIKQLSKQQEDFQKDIMELQEVREESELNLGDSQRQLLMGNYNHEEFEAEQEEIHTPSSAQSSLRKALTLNDKDNKLQMLFPPMQVIPEERVFHISGEDEEDFDESYDGIHVQYINQDLEQERKKSSNFLFTKSQTQDLPYISNTISTAPPTLLSPFMVAQEPKSTPFLNQKKTSTSISASNDQLQPPPVSKEVLSEDPRDNVSGQDSHSEDDDYDDSNADSSYYETVDENEVKSQTQTKSGDATKTYRPSSQSHQGNTQEDRSVSAFDRDENVLVEDVDQTERSQAEDQQEKELEMEFDNQHEKISDSRSYSLSDSEKTPPKKQISLVSGGSPFFKRMKTQVMIRSEQNKLFLYSYQIVHSEPFQFFIQISIITNTVLQSLDQHPAPTYIEKIDFINSMFSVVFIIEMVLKILGLGFKSYFEDIFNIFDCFIAMVALFDLVLSSAVTINVDAVNTLRTFRLLRLFKLARTWKQFNHLLATMGKTLKEISAFSVVLFLFMFIYSILGMEMFAYKAMYDASGNLDMETGESVDQNFDSFLWSFTTVFVLLTEDGWSTVYQLYHVAVGGWRANLYFLSLFIIGPRILLNIFLAILMENFENDSLDQQQDEIKAMEELEKKNKGLGSENKMLMMLTQSVENSTHSALSGQIESMKRCGKFLDNIVSLVRSYVQTCFIKRKVKPEETNEEKSERLNMTMNFGGNYKDVLLDMISSSKPFLSRSKTKRTQLLESEVIDEIDLTGVSLGLFSSDNAFRIYLYKLVNGSNKWFERLIVTFIAISSIQLALTNPLNDPKGFSQRILYWLDFLTTIVFLAECIMKIIAFGFLLNDQSSYLRNPWNLIDFVIIMVSVVAISPLANKLQVFKMFRILRVVRLISRAEGLRIGLQALIQAIPNVIRIVTMLVLFFLIFGIIAISYFKGRFFDCVQMEPVTLTINSYVEEQAEIVSKWDCINMGYEWQRRYYNFDNMYQAIASLFILSNLAGWQDFMYTGTKVTEIDMVLKRGSNPYWVFFFIAFIIFGAFFLMNLFQGIVISSFNRQRENLGGYIFLQEKERRDWVETHQMVLKSVPIPRAKKAESKFGQLCQSILQHPKFEPFIYGSIIFNVFILCLKWEGISQQLLDVFEKVNIFITGIFVVEAIVKITGIGGQYFIDYWNIFDFFVTILSCTTIVLDGLGTVQLGGSMMVIRSFRISKVLRLIKKTKSLRHIFKTFIQCLQPLTNIGSLLLLILYMYTIAGVILFGQVKRNGKLTDTLNFETFGNGALALFVVSTTDAWTDIAQSCLKRPSVDFDCIPNPTYEDFIQNGRQTMGCGAKFSGILYFYSYFLVMGLILLKLFVAIICQAYEDIKVQEQRSFNDEAIEQFNQVWNKHHDENNVIFIPINQMKKFFTDLNKESNFNGKLFWKSGDTNQVGQAQNEYLRDQKFNVYNSFSSYLYYEILDSVAQKLIMHDYAIQARKEEAEQLSGVQTEDANNETISPDEPKTPQTPADLNLDFSPITPMDEDQQVKSPEELAKEKDLLKLEEECKELQVDFIEKINHMLQTQAGKVIAIKEINIMRENLMFVHNLNDLQEKIGECDQHNPDKVHFHAMTSKHLYLAHKIFKQMIVFWQLKKNPVQEIEVQADQQSDVSSQNHVAKSDASEHQQSRDGEDTSQNTSYQLDDGTETKQNQQNEHDEKPQELIGKLLKMSMKLKIDTDIALEKKSPVKWEGLKQSALRGVSDTSPLRLQLQACREPEPPKDVVEIKDSDSIHPCLFKAMNQAKEQLGWHLFDPLECTVELKRERLRSAGPKKSQVIETQVIPKRPQSAQRAHLDQHQPEQGTKLEQSTPIILFQSPAKRQSMLQNFMKESPMVVNTHSPDNQHLFKFRSAGKYERNRRIQGNFSIKDSESAIQVKSATFSIGKRTFNSPSPFKHQ